MAGPVAGAFIQQAQRLLAEADVIEVKTGDDMLLIQRKLVEATDQLRRASIANGKPGQ
jgi:hypothetical protein